MESSPARPSVAARLAAALPSMAGAERRVAEWILSNPEPVLHMSMSQLAGECDVSDTTVLRMCRSAHLRGYTELKILIAQDLVSPTHMVHEDLSEDDDMGTTASKLFASGIQALTESLELLDIDGVERLARALCTSRTVLLAAQGASQVVAQATDHRLTRMGLTVVAPADAHSQIVRATALVPGDVVIAVSHAGTTKDTVAVCETAKAQGAYIAVLTSDASSPAALIADVCLTSVSREIRGEPYAAKLAQLAIIDLIAIAFARQNLDSVAASESRIATAIAGRYL